MKPGKLVYRQLYFGAIWMVYAIIQGIIGIQLDSKVIILIAGILMGSYCVVLITLILDLVLKDDVQIEGEIVEIQPEIIVVETGQRKQKQIVRKYVDASGNYVEQQHVIIWETRRSCIFNGMQ